MASTSNTIRRQYGDIFTEISHATVNGQTVAGVTTGTTGTLAVTVPGVDTSGKWYCIALTTTANIGSLDMEAQPTSANTVTIYFANTTAGTVTPTASSTYTVVMGKLQQRFVT